MANNFVSTGSRITVGQETGSGINILDKKPYEKSPYGGLSILNGPIQIGNTKLKNPPLGVLYVGDTVTSSGPTALASIYVKHPSKGIKLDSDDIGIEVDAAKTNTIKAGTLNEYTAPDNTFVGDVNVTSGNLKSSHVINCTGASNAWANSTIDQQTWKGFDITHPTKENYRLRHICLEGPEAGVYVRGRLTGNRIELPEYWSKLVDTDSITVSLTAIGVGNQDLYVEKIEWGRTVIVKSGTGTKVDCYYVIHGSRIDGEPLIVEYEGESPAQYPGNSEQFSISGYDYGRGVDKPS